MSERRSFGLIAALFAPLLASLFAAQGCEQILGLDKIESYGSGGSTPAGGAAGSAMTASGGSAGTGGLCNDPMTDCPAPANACRLAECDGAGQCAEKALDGVQVPGTTPGECGSQTCVQGEVSGSNAAEGTACVLPAGGPGACDGKGACVQCMTKDDCDDGIPESECHQWVCLGGACANTTEKDGPLASQLPADCRTKTCKSGLFSNPVDASDVFDDGNDCTLDECDAAGIPTNNPVPASTPCGAGGLLFCNGTGKCTGCAKDSQCAGGTDCLVPHCMVDMAGDGACTLTPEPPGKVTSMQVPGDCIDNVCDANGNIVQAFQMSDPQDDNNACTVDTCAAMNVSQHTPVPSGQACSDGGGVVCDAAAHCVGKMCSAMGDCPIGTFCTDGVCCDSTCNGTCLACTGAKKGGGPDGLCGPVVAGDPDGECPGNSSCAAGVCKTLSNGAACLNAVGECASSNCVDGVCCNTACNAACRSCNLIGFAGTCSSLPSGQADNFPANACNGVNSCDGLGGCKKNDGQACAAGNDCVHGNCIDGVCCGTASCATCQTCNGATPGTCSNIATGLPDNFPVNACNGVNSCNGAGACKKNDGQTCSVSSDCVHGNCADGVCCNTACTMTCQSCNVAGLAGQCSNTPYGQQDTFPASSCVTPNSCDGAGGCKKNDGQTCSVGSDCLHGNCVDGFCCNVACNGTCQACSNALTGLPNGTCANIPANTDPSNECMGAQVCSMMGTCVAGPNGALCAAMGTDANCASGFCADSFCCATSCSGTCQACASSKTGQQNGTCANITNGTDPDNECAGAQNCNGAGVCQ